MRNTLKFVVFTVFLIYAFAATASTESTSPSSEEAEYRKMAQQLWDSLNKQQGKVMLPNKVASLNLGKDFYYLDQSDAEKVLVQVWGNPEGSASELLGMLFKQGMTPFDQNSWGVTISYEEDGYVSDENAKDIDYDDMLAQMKDDAAEASRQRVKMGYEPIQLVGWAAKPFYDQSSHKLHWAKEIKFGSDPDNTLNYNIRVLGRKGVLVLNFISSMAQKDAIDQSIDSVLKVAEFETGSRYEDFVPGADKVAAYGIGALVAGKVMAKAGIFAGLLLLLKKFWIFVALGIGGLFKMLFGRKKQSAS